MHSPWPARPPNAQATRLPLPARLPPARASAPQDLRRAPASVPQALPVAASPACCCAPAARYLVPQHPTPVSPARRERALTRPASPAARPCRVVVWMAVSRPCVTTQSSSSLSLLSQYNIFFFVLRYNFFPSQPSCHNTLDCIAIQSQPSPLQYKPVYCNTLPARPRCLIAIQFPVLQYNFHSPQAFFSAIQ